jgi:phage-related tail protein
MAQTQFGRFDKYDGMVGGFRAPLAANMSATGDDIGKVQGVSINTSGRVVVGAAAETAIIGVICPTRVMTAGEFIDVMTDGEIMDVVKTAGTAWAAGDIVTVAVSGALGSTAVGAGFKAVGKILEPPKASGLGARMLVRCPIPTT